MRYRSIFATVATVGLLGAGIGFAQAPGVAARQEASARSERGMRGPGGGGLERLNLSDAQREQLQQLREQQREEGKPTFEKLPELQQQLHQAIFSGKGDVAAIALQINELQGQMLQQRIEHQQKVAAILTPEQREQMASAPAGRGPGFGRRPGPGRGPF